MTKQDKATENKTEDFTLPPEIQKKFEEMAIHTTAMEQMITKAILDYVKNSGEEKIDISIPLEALARCFMNITLDLDQKILPEVLESHRDIRVGLNKRTMDGVRTFVSEQTEHPVYAQDIYISLIVAIMTYIQQYRLHHIDQIVKEESEAHEESSVQH